MHYDAIVIGAGSMGSAAGYFLAKNNKKTLLLDSFSPPHMNGSHHGDTRIIRYAYAEGEKYIPFILRAKQLWEELSEETGRELFLPTGVLNVGRDQSNFIETIKRSAAAYDLPIEVMDAEEIHRRWNGVTVPEDYVGCYEETSGVLKSEECITTYLQRAVEEGATLHTDERVLDLDIHDAGVIVKTEKATYSADSLVITTGAWSKKILQKTNIELPLTTLRKTFTWFQVNEQKYSSAHFPAFAFETEQGIYYGFPSIAEAGLKIGRHDGGLLIEPDQPIQPFVEGEQDQSEIERFIDTFMQGSERQFTYGKTCVYTVTPDEDFIIDVHPSYKHIAFAAGFSGHGFKFSSAVGEVLSDFICKGKTELPITPFSLRRFFV